jgi:hypothetical protein
MTVLPEISVNINPETMDACFVICDPSKSFAGLAIWNRWNYYPVNSHFGHNGSKASNQNIWATSSASYWGNQTHICRMCPCYHWSQTRTQIIVLDNWSDWWPAFASISIDIIIFTGEIWQHEQSLPIDFITASVKYLRLNGLLQTGSSHRHDKHELTSLYHREHPPTEVACLVAPIFEESSSIQVLFTKAA